MSGAGRRVNVTQQKVSALTRKFAHALTSASPGVAFISIFYWT
jgi:hypothetical protein